MMQIILDQGEIRIFSNPSANSSSVYPPALKRIVDSSETPDIHDEIRRWPDYDETPLHCLAGIATELNVSKIWYKDESTRFGLKSFKALGGAYAVAKQIRKIIVDASVDEPVDERWDEPSLSDLLDHRYRNLISKLVMTCATDGNHGRSVAWGCSLFGCASVIYIHREVSAGRAHAMEALGATIVRVDGNYDDSVRQAAFDAELHGRTVISDTSYPGYVDIPRDVTMGYTVMLAEIVDQLENDIPTHVFVQAGVGGLAAMVCGYFWSIWGARRPRFIVVEPEQANCLQQSAQNGKPTIVDGELPTLMAGLACGEVSLSAWELLAQGANDFLTVNEASVPQTMKLLAQGCFGDPEIEAGESAVAGLAALIAARFCEVHSRALGLDSESKILVVGTEGATDQTLYEQLIAIG
jgi:diaminopropionate ammonia-lyase